MQRRTTDFLLFILGGKFWIFTQIVTERKMPSDREITVGEAMNLNPPRPVPRTRM